ncbi:glycerol-3-phosphate responsive antiterminator [Pontibacillus halophilus JSM 076056 = DSM 19796]|uniref:Glycerol uptake operon antiterminator regulatory protein n=1 Tax=Pontibacillus halophilus JSM 076056 = DSM 19796 TaxID=1385510 RepID=A0A0A5GLP6_9BACI|nr:glycerol-3-phosphate responsive antiterminator [Pontibacillus halophilus]KGX92919.1 glycerol-3-phosphate responsive antiterminator [Pontibacillus halophilus JSM 076056 = DSM 19796]
MGLSGVLPAAKSLKDFEKLLEFECEYIILLEVRVSQLKNVVRYAKRANKKVIIHVDLVQGLKNDEYATEFICQEIKPYGVISTRTSVITTAKKHNIVAVQRLFLLDSNAINHNVRLIEKSQPDYVEVLPGIIPHMIEELKDRLDIPLIAGGLLRTEADVTRALDAGAVAITSSDRELWNY